LVLVGLVFFTHHLLAVVKTLCFIRLHLLVAVLAVTTTKQVRLEAQAAVKQKVTARVLGRQIKEQQVVMV
jgi:hypothetical protein